MAQKLSKWVSITAGDFQATLDNLKGLVMENRAEPQKDIEQVVSQIRKTVGEAVGRAGNLGLQKLHEVLTVLEIAADLFIEDGLKDDAADLMALHTELKAIKERLEAKR
jgi:hypothetical protein